MTTNAITTISKSLSPIVDKALSITISDKTTLEEAVTLLSQLNKFNDKIDEEREKVTAPLNEALKAERARWKPAELANTEAINYLRKEMTAYQTLQVQIQKAKEHAIAEKLTAGKISLDKAVKQIEKVKTPEKNIATTAGDVQFRETQRYEVMDLSLIFTRVKTDRHGVAVVTIDNELLAKYILPNDKAITEAMKNGIEVPGVRYYTEQVPVNYR